MILVIGGAFCGKREYVKSLGYSEDQMADACLDDSPVIYNVQAMVENNPASAAQLLEPLLQKEVVICNEVGSGVIPDLYQKRAAREECGRLCVNLANSAQKVVRVVAGIPTVIKG